jgi:carboxymethylenebutenolidase
MCDEFTEAGEDEALAAKGLTRRDFAAMGAAATIAACSGGNGEARPAGPSGASLSESMVQVPTPDGTCDAFFVHPASGVHPGVVFWPDVAGLREAKKVMARRLAGAGYAVLVVNQYYRGARAPIVETMADYRTPEGQAKLGPLRAGVTAETVTRDGAAFVAFLDGQAAVDTRRKIGTQGYCMGGPFTVRTAFAAPERVGAAASFHGGGLVGDADDSPHKLLARTRASYLVAVARNDDARAPADKDTLRQAAAAAGRPMEIEVYPADHGWCVPDAPAYDPVQADRAWERLLALYARL